MRNVRRADTYEAVVRQLTESNSSSRPSVFPTMRELLCFAAVVGFHDGKRTSIEGKTHEIDARIFGNSPTAIDLLYLIALAHKREVNVLRDENDDEMIRIFEEFANTGLDLIAQWLREKPDDLVGDGALLSAMYRYGFLGSPAKTVEDVVGDVKF
jgi:dnd system-associated protein 4